MDRDKYFITLDTLRETIKESNNLKIIHPGSVWIASFSWNPPAHKDTFNQLENNLKKKLPEELSLFMTEISDGVTLYFDIKYGQWGYRIYSSSELIEKQKEWIELFTEAWSSNFVVIGEIIDDLHPIIIDSGNPSSNSLNWVVLEGNPYDPISDWKKMGDSLKEWLDRLITSQGAKFWDWF